MRTCTIREVIGNTHANKLNRGMIFGVKAGRLLGKS